MPISDISKSKKEQINMLLKRKKNPGIIFAPNYWQWFSHHRDHGILPNEIKHCKDQFQMIKHLGLHTFSRNIYCNEKQYWFGGLADEKFSKVQVITKEHCQGNDKIIEKTYVTKQGEIKEYLRYDFSQSTLIQEKYLIDNYKEQYEALWEIVQDRSWEFDLNKYNEETQRIGEDGIIMAGELFSPLKMLHLFLGPVETVYSLELPDFKDRMKELLDIHEKRQLELVEQMARAGVLCMIAMDNLDAMFHPPKYIEKYSASFYEKASKICHEYGSNFFIHACGKQKAILPLISSLGVDGLEGVAYPPLGDIELDHAMRITHGSFIITGGISAHETMNLTSREQVFNYVKELFKRMEPYSNRFVVSASCNTPIDTNWETIKHFRDAWVEYSDTSY